MKQKQAISNGNTSPTWMAKRIELWPLDRLIPYARNARTHSDAQVAQIAASILEFGFTNPILVDHRNGVIAGHGRLLAARKLGLEQVPVVTLDHLTPAQKRAYILADNKLALNAGWDEDTLKAELASLQEDGFDLDLLGFSEDELGNFLADSDSLSAADEDAVPELPEIPSTLAGDLWILGKHRLLCGDATNSTEVKRLMNGELADCVFTDPPYNVDYEGYTGERLKIEGDKMTATRFRSFLDETFASYRAVVKTEASLYVCHSSSWQREFQDAIETAGFQVRCQIVWAKNTFAWGFGRYKFQHEPIFYCHVIGNSDVWYGDKSQSTLWQENKPAANRLHPTMKPVELIERALWNSSKRNNIVVDLFGGSGSTLIACEKNGRQARLMEMDPKYCDVIIRRWQEYSGKAARHESGRKFEEIRTERGSTQT